MENNEINPVVKEDTTIEVKLPKIKLFRIVFLAFRWVYGYLFKRAVKMTLQKYYFKAIDSSGEITILDIAWCQTRKDAIDTYNYWVAKLNLTRLANDNEGIIETYTTRIAEPKRSMYPFKRYIFATEFVVDD